MGNRIGDARPGQIITTFGPGSIIDAKKDCVTITDINYWPDNGFKIKDSRFASYIGVDHFRVPPTGNQFTSEDVPVVIFPDVHICSSTKCSKIFKISEHMKVDKYKTAYLKFGPTCPYCGYSAYPSRFVRVCSNGHLDDFDYSAWVHKGGKCSGNLKIYTTGYTSSLGDIFVECELCKSKRSLSGITSKDNETQCKCNGFHPFRPSFASKKCSSKMLVLQRGASNVYFPVIKSAISIPPYIDKLYVMIEDRKHELETYRGISSMLPATPEEVLYNMHFKSEYTYDEFEKALKNIEAGVKDYSSIKESEYKAIINHDDPVNKKSPLIFNAEEDPVPLVLKPYFSRIIRINRLREIMCLKGFTRLDAPDPEAEDQVNIVHLNSKDGWLPGIEIHGEGVFIEFDKNMINSWLSKPSISKLDKIVKDSFENYCLSRGWNITNQRGVVYMLMHTFSHLLIKEMGDKSGYSTSSIKERIYCSDSMHAILLYTGSSDKEGSLGGLVELGKSNKIQSLIKSAFEKALICTNDPECMLASINSDLNISACHACCMISETACENGNRLLNRQLIVPISDNEELSYFKDLVKDMCNIE